MKTDSIFYQLWQIFPLSFFELLNLPADTVNHYQFSSVEVKQLSFRLDGVFLPDSLHRPIYFVEVQFQKDNQFYSRFFTEIFLYLHQSDLDNNWQGVIIYPNRLIDTGRYFSLSRVIRLREGVSYLSGKLKRSRISRHGYPTINRSGGASSH